MKRTNFLSFWRTTTFLRSSKMLLPSLLVTLIPYSICHMSTSASCFSIESMKKSFYFGRTTIKILSTTIGPLYLLKRHYYRHKLKCLWEWNSAFVRNLSTLSNNLNRIGYSFWISRVVSLTFNRYVHKWMTFGRTCIMMRGNGFGTIFKMHMKLSDSVTTSFLR